MKEAYYTKVNTLSEEGRAKISESNHNRSEELKEKDRARMLKYSLAKAHSILFFLLKKKGSHECFHKRIDYLPYRKTSCHRYWCLSCFSKKNLLKQSIV